MFLGRFLFGCGGESFIVANTTFITSWFAGKELALAFGINMSISKLGSVWNNIMSPFLLHKYHNINISFLFGFFLCILCNVIVIVSNWMEKNAITSLKTKHHYKPLNTKPTTYGTQQSKLYDESLGKEGKRKELEMNTSRTSSSVYSVSNQATPAIADHEEDYEEGRGHVSDGGDDGSEEEEEEQEEQIRFNEVFNFKLDFWLLVFICFICYSVVAPFNNISASLLMERDYFKPLPPSCHLADPHQCPDPITNPAIGCPTGLHYQALLPQNYSSYNPLHPSFIDCSDNDWSENPCTGEYCHRFKKATWYANSAMSIPYAITACTSPFIGYFVDKFGYRGKLNLMFGAILIVSHCLLSISASFSPIIPLIGQGIAYSIFSSVLWSSIPLIVKSRVLGFSFGITTCIQNLGTGMFPIVIAAIYKKSGHRYIPNVEYLFIVLGILGLVACCALNYYDSHYGAKKFQ
jgi:MFS family permease